MKIFSIFILFFYFFEDDFHFQIFILFENVKYNFHFETIIMIGSMISYSGISNNCAFELWFWQIKIKFGVSGGWECKW